MGALAEVYSDPTGQFDTKLSPQDEARFQQWMRTLPANLQSTEDYDLRGAWKSNAQAATNGHLPDTWKKPNHPTFSSESMYSSPANGQGGNWVDAPGGKYVYWASPANLRYQSAPSLASYFKEREPDSSVVLPINYSLPRGR